MSNGGRVDGADDALLVAFIFAVAGGLIGGPPGVAGGRMWGSSWERRSE